MECNGLKDSELYREVSKFGKNIFFDNFVVDGVTYTFEQFYDMILSKKSTLYANALLNYINGNYVNAEQKFDMFNHGYKILLEGSLVPESYHMRVDMLARKANNGEDSKIDLVIYHVQPQSNYDKYKDAISIMKRLCFDHAKTDFNSRIQIDFIKTYFKDLDTIIDEYCKSKYSYYDGNEIKLVKKDIMNRLSSTLITDFGKFKNELINISNFGEMYEIGLATEDKIKKKKSGQYYTPDDVAMVMSQWLDNCDGDNVCDVACGTGKLILTYLDYIGKRKALNLLKIQNYLNLFKMKH